MKRFRNPKSMRSRFCLPSLGFCTSARIFKNSAVDSRYKRLQYKILCPIRYFSWRSHIMVSATKSTSYKIPHPSFHINGIRYYPNLGSQRVFYKESLPYSTAFIVTLKRSIWRPYIRQQFLWNDRLTGNAIQGHRQICERLIFYSRW